MCLLNKGMNEWQINIHGWNGTNTTINVTVRIHNGRERRGINILLIEKSSGLF